MLPGDVAVQGCMGQVANSPDSDPEAPLLLGAGVFVSIMLLGQGPGQDSAAAFPQLWLKWEQLLPLDIKARAWTQLGLTKGSECITGK